MCERTWRYVYLSQKKMPARYHEGTAFTVTFALLVLLFFAGVEAELGEAEKDGCLVARKAWADHGFGAHTTVPESPLPGL